MAGARARLCLTALIAITLLSGAPASADSSWDPQYGTCFTCCSVYPSGWRGMCLRRCLPLDPAERDGGLCSVSAHSTGLAGGSADDSTVLTPSSVSGDGPELYDKRGFGPPSQGSLTWIKAHTIGWATIAWVWRKSSSIGIDNRWRLRWP